MIAPETSELALALYGSKPICDILETESLHMSISLRIVLAASLVTVFSWAPSIEAREDPSPPTGVSLTYSETRPTEKTTCSGGGLLGAMNCVTERIEGAGEGGEISATAALSLELIPVLRAEDNSTNMKVHVRVDAGSPSITGEFQDQKQVESDVDADARLVKERLKRWSKTLLPGQLDELRTKGETQIAISRPFEGLKRLGLENPPATLTVVMLPKPKLISLEALDAGRNPLREIEERVPFVLKATYDADHPDDRISVDIPIAASSKKQVVLRKTEDPSTFRSDWLIVEPNLEPSGESE